MSTQVTGTARLQLVEPTRKSCSVSQKELCARDYSEHFHRLVSERFVATQSLRQTARDFKIPARVVSEILHLANFRRPMSIARSATAALEFISVREARRTA